MMRRIRELPGGKWHILPVRVDRPELSVSPAPSGCGPGAAGEGGGVVSLTGIGARRPGEGPMSWPSPRRRTWFVDGPWVGSSPVRGRGGPRFPPVYSGGEEELLLGRCLLVEVNLLPSGLRGEASSPRVWEGSSKAFVREKVYLSATFCCWRHGL